MAIVLALSGFVAVAESDGAPEVRRRERIARRGIEAVLSFVLETDVAVESVRLDGDANILELGNLTIANPRGFDRDTPAMSFEKILVEAPLDVLFASEPVFQTVKIQGGTVHAEINPRRGVNIKRLMDSADRFKGPQLLPQKRWVVEQALMEDFALKVTTQLLRRETRERHVESLEMTLKRDDGRGFTASEALTRILGQLIDELDLLNLEDPIIPLGELFRR